MNEEHFTSMISAVPCKKQVFWHNLLGNELHRTKSSDCMGPPIYLIKQREAN